LEKDTNIKNEEEDNVIRITTKIHKIKENKDEGLSLKGEN
jgi:hypothetical protein